MTDQRLGPTKPRAFSASPSGAQDFTEQSLSAKLRLPLEVAKQDHGVSKGFWG